MCYQSKYKRNKKWMGKKCNPLTNIPNKTNSIKKYSIKLRKLSTPSWKNASWMWFCNTELLLINITWQTEISFLLIHILIRKTHTKKEKMNSSCLSEFPQRYKNMYITGVSIYYKQVQQKNVLDTCNSFTSWDAICTVALWGST